MKKNNKFVLYAGLVLLLIFASMAFAPTLFTGYRLKEMFDPWIEAFSPGHILGTNSLGYDIYTELVYGCKRTLMIGLPSGICSLLLGTVIGILASSEGIVGSLFSGLINVFLLIPRLVCLIVLSSFMREAILFGSSDITLITLISAFSWVATARNVKAKVQHIKAQPFIESLRLFGFSNFRIAFAHILPNLFDVLLSRFLLGINSCIMMESTLAFLGLGDTYFPTWGTMVSSAFRLGAFVRGAYAYILAPGICIMLLSLSFYLISIYIDERKDLIQE